jgi:hypothetical protein
MWREGGMNIEMNKLRDGEKSDKSLFLRDWQLYFNIFLYRTLP